MTVYVSQHSYPFLVTFTFAEVIQQTALLTQFLPIYCF